MGFHGVIDKTRTGGDRDDTNRVRRSMPRLREAAAYCPSTRSSHDGARLSIPTYRFHRFLVTSWRRVMGRRLCNFVNDSQRALPSRYSYTGANRTDLVTPSPPYASSQRWRTITFPRLCRSLTYSFSPKNLGPGPGQPPKLISVPVVSTTHNSQYLDRTDSHGLWSRSRAL